jgi:putative transposase
MGRAETIIQRRKEIKAKTIHKRRLLHRQNAA